MPEPKLYQFSTHLGAACAKQFRTFADLAEKLKMDVTDLMRQCYAKEPPLATLSALALQRENGKLFSRGDSPAQHRFLRGGTRWGNGESPVIPTSFYL
jgi:hypothetical protein